MAVKPLPEQETLLKFFDYDPSTGRLHRREREPSDFVATSTRTPEHQCALWNKRWASTSVDRRLGRYFVVGWYGRYFYAHRVIWKMVYGRDPLEVDHINGDRGDNRLENLRSVSRRTNRRNLALNARNTSGRAGIRWHKGVGKWEARYSHTSLGYFLTFPEAVRVRKAEELKRGHLYRG